MEKQENSLTDRSMLLCGEESKRIDIVKFIAVIFVLFIHSYSTTLNFADNKGDLELSSWLLKYQEAISLIISRCGVPLFFLISAILFFSVDRKYFTVLKTKCRTILVPYLFWNTFWIVVWIALQQIPFCSNLFSGDNVRILDRNLVGWLELYGISFEYPSYPLDYPLWFMRDLFVMFLFFPLIRLATSKFPKISLLLGVVLIFLPQHMFQTSLSWFLIGGAFVNLDFHIKAIDKVSFWKVALAYVAGFLIALFTANDYVRTIFIFVGMCFWIRLSKVIYDNHRICNIFLKMSSWTFIIYVMHELTLSSVKKFCLRILPTTDLCIFLQYNLIPFFIMAVCVLIGVCMTKFTPRLYSLATGGRIKQN